MTHQELGTTKYYLSSLTEEMKELRKQRNKEAVQNFKLFIFVMVVVCFTVTAIKMMPQWLPIVSNIMDQYGVTEVLQRWA
ncbi:MAG: hypothetical protein AB8B55_19940 [Mariniblastus sp.]